MQVNVQAGAIQEVSSDLVVVNLFQGVDQPGGAAGAVDSALGGSLRELIAIGDFKGNAEEMALLYSRGAIPAKRVLVVGLGKPEDFTLDVVRRVSAVVARKARELGVTHYHSIVHGAGTAGLDPAEAAQAVVEGTLLGSYRFDIHKARPENPEPELEALTLVQLDEASLPAIQAGVRVGQVVAESVTMVRDLVNQPCNFCTPTLLAEAAEQIAAEAGLAFEVLGEREMADLGMGALLGVAQGSNEPAQFIILEHNRDRSDLPTYVIVGKGITFDAGGLSIKSTGGMQGMKLDMAGAAAVIGVLHAIGKLDLPLHVVGLAPATENLPGGRAYRPGDVLKSMSGTTIEVITTDAEGRLILADALNYAARYKPQAVVDIATLTGGSVVALGHVAAGLMGNDAELMQTIKVASEQTNEKVWELPFFKEYEEQIESSIADVKNSGGGDASAITAGLFLRKFTDYPWAHVDMPGMMASEGTSGYTVNGATGFGTRLLIQWLRDRANQAS
ncbi:MAG: leucyl aminopeptidase [Chloroflexi bacterium]|nr:leucyl aminopeptidase [Chloroflexota bacterium]